MIIGTGIDIQEIKQIKDIYSRKEQRFIERVFTPTEIDYCQRFKEPYKHYAARWAVKEAFLKAWGTGINKGYNLRDIETIHLSSGQPIVNVSGKLQEDFVAQGISSFVSISHSGSYAVAQVILYQKQERF